MHEFPTSLLFCKETLPAAADLLSTTAVCNIRGSVASSWLT
jgi:hypothetical protein